MPKHKIRVSELKNLSIEELKQKERELRNELMVELTKKQAGGTAENPGRIRELRRNIARIKTLISLKEKETLNIEKTK